MSEIFLVDTNIFITPYEQYYPFDLAQNFWIQFGAYIEKGEIAVLDMVRDEVLKGKDDLSKWLKGLNCGCLIEHQEVVPEYAAILQYIQNNDCYRQSAVTEWSRATVADAWLIAAAKKRGYALVTFEKFNQGVNAKNKSKTASIPNIAADFNVKTVDLFYMMRTLNIKLYGEN